MSALLYRSFFVSLCLRYVLPYQLILRQEDNVIDPQTNCYHTLKGKIAKQEDIAKNEELIAGCVPANLPFWIGPLTRVDKSDYLAGKMCLIINTTMNSHHITCTDDETYFPGNAYICRTVKWHEGNGSGGLNCMKQTDSVGTTLHLTSLPVEGTSYSVADTPYSKSNENSTISRDADTFTVTTEAALLFRNTKVIRSNKRHNLEIRKEKVNNGSQGFLDKHKVQVAIVLGTLLFTVVVISAVALLFKLKRRHSKLRRDSSASDRNRIYLESQYIKKSSRGDIRSLASCTLSHDIEIFVIDDNEQLDDDDDVKYMYHDLQRSVSDPVINMTYKTKQ